MMRAVLDWPGGESVLRFDAETVRVTLGRGGLAAQKQEGDGVTPRAVMALRRVLYRADRLSAAEHQAIARSLPLEPIAPGDGWCDDPGQADYNRAVALPYGGRHERMWRDDGLYDIVAVLGWNDAPVVRDRGSAIFLHVARPDGAPTEGCLAMARADLVALLARGLCEVDTA